ncbi:MAG TPA: hypothetical protein VFD36_09365 [Kofleriaceae bacterium]|nr:hypothetical protein [Kofleriaceae bacterium]
MARRQGPNIGQLIADAQSRRARSFGTGGPHGIMWFIDLRFEEPHWYRARARMASVVDAFAATSWFGELEVLGRDHAVGARFDSLDALRDAIACGEPGTFIVARGEPRLARDSDESETAMAFDVSPRSLEIRVWIRARPVAQYRSAVLGEIIALVLALRDAWSDVVVANAYAFPHPPDALAYRRPRPPRTSARSIDAVVDIVDRDAPPDGPPWARDARAIAAADVPDGVERIERGRLVALRWIDDPADPAAMAEACSRHAQWLVGVVPTEIPLGWNADGDLQVPVFGTDARPEPLTLFDAQRGAGYLEVQVGPGGEVDSETWKVAENVIRRKILTSGKRVQSVSLVVGDRATATRINERARAHGFDAVLYRDKSGTLWDPFPPGFWAP